MIYYYYYLLMISSLQELVNNRTERISWNEYFMSIAIIASSRSSCCKLNVGSVIVKDNRIISVGYNGHIAGTSHSFNYIRDNHQMETVHSEVNSIVDCAKRGVSLLNSTIYITHYPCINCFKMIASCEIKTIYYLNDYKNDELVSLLAKEANINIIKYV